MNKNVVSMAIPIPQDAAGSKTPSMTVPISPIPFSAAEPEATKPKELADSAKPAPAVSTALNVVAGEEPTNLVSPATPPEPSKLKEQVSARVEGVSGAKSAMKVPKSATKPVESEKPATQISKTSGKQRKSKIEALVGVAQKSKQQYPLESEKPTMSESRKQEKSGNEKSLKPPKPIKPHSPALKSQGKQKSSPVAPTTSKRKRKKKKKKKKKKRKTEENEESVKQDSAEKIAKSKKTHKSEPEAQSEKQKKASAEKVSNKEIAEAQPPKDTMSQAKPPIKATKSTLSVPHNILGHQDSESKSSMHDPYTATFKYPPPILNFSRKSWTPLVCSFFITETLLHVLQYMICYHICYYGGDDVITSVTFMYTMSFLLMCSTVSIFAYLTSFTGRRELSLIVLIFVMFKFAVDLSFLMFFWKNVRSNSFMVISIDLILVMYCCQVLRILQIACILNYGNRFERYNQKKMI